jgi:hypothetical protein
MAHMVYLILDKNNKEIVYFKIFKAKEAVKFKLLLKTNIVVAYQFLNNKYNQKNKYIKYKILMFISQQ